jgi:hypothetical protein
MKNYIKKIIKEALDEALRDELPDYMIKAVKANNPKVADKFLDMDVPKHTELIPNVKIEIDESNIKDRFIKEIQKHFTDSILEQFQDTKLFENFYKKNIIANFLQQGLNMEMPIRDAIIYFQMFFNKQIFKKIASEQKRFIDKLKFFYSKEFPLLQGKDNDLLKPIFSKNKSNLFTYIKSFNTAFPQHAIDLNAIMNDRIFQGLREPIMNFEQNVNDLANSKLYLYITDKPADVLRMSVSQFYSSCQNMYTGMYKEKLLSNVFDENSKIAYLIFDSSYVDNQGNKHPFSPIARTIIRVGENNKIMFDKTYPNSMQNEFYSIIEKNTQLKNQGTSSDIYKYKNVGLPAPYMDRYKLKTSGGYSRLENNDRAVALADELNADIKELEEISDTRFTYGNAEYDVYTEDEANEYALDYLRDSWTEYLGETSLSELVDNKVLNKDSVYDILEIDDDYLQELGYDFEDYLSDYLDIETLWDFEKILKKKVSSYWNWYQDGDTYDLNNLIGYFGGINELRTVALARYDGRELYNNNYFIYRAD